jgi:DNA-directed RNA polymerase subunit RPC12/RpoP
MPSETRTHCPDCGTRLKLLYSSWFCPKECDKKPKEGWGKRSLPDPDIDWEWDQDRITKPMGNAGQQAACLHIYSGPHAQPDGSLKYVCKYCGHTL